MDSDDADDNKRSHSQGFFVGHINHIQENISRQ